MKSKDKIFLSNNEMISNLFRLKSSRNVPVFWNLGFLFFFFFQAILADAQMNHANDLGPALLHCSKINI